MRKIVFVSISVISIWFAASCGGPTGTSTTTGSAQGGNPAATAVVSGEAVYTKTCIACHQANGVGIANSFPPLAKSDFITDRAKTITQVIKGASGEVVVNGDKYNNVMPPQPLNDDEIAAVLTYVYSNFGNTGAAITVAEVKAVRAKL